MATDHTRFTNPFHGPNTAESASFDGSDLKEAAWLQEFRHDSGVRTQSVREASECPLPVVEEDINDRTDEYDTCDAEDENLLAEVNGLSDAEDGESNKVDPAVVDADQNNIPMDWDAIEASAEVIEGVDPVSLPTITEDADGETAHERSADGIGFRNGAYNGLPRDGAVERWEHSNDTTQVSNGSSTDEDRTLIADGASDELLDWTMGLRQVSNSSRCEAGRRYRVREDGTSPLNGAMSSHERSRSPSPFTRAPATENDRYNTDGHIEQATNGVPLHGANLATNPATHGSTRRRRSTFTELYVGRERFVAENNLQIGLTAEEDDHDVTLRAVDEGQLVGRAAVEAEIRASIAELAGTRTVRPGGRRSSFADVMRNSPFDPQVVRDREARAAFVATVSSHSRSEGNLQLTGLGPGAVVGDGDQDVDRDEDPPTPPDRYWGPNAGESVARLNSSSSANDSVMAPGSRNTSAAAEPALDDGYWEAGHLTHQQTSSDPIGWTRNAQQSSENDQSTSTRGQRLTVLVEEIDPATDESEDDHGPAILQQSKSSTGKERAFSPDREAWAPQSLSDRTNERSHGSQPRSHPVSSLGRARLPTRSLDDTCTPLARKPSHRQPGFADDDLRSLAPTLRQAAQGDGNSRPATPLLPGDNGRKPQTFRESEDFSPPYSPPEHRTPTPRSAFKLRNSDEKVKRNVSFSEITKVVPLPVSD